MAKKPPNYGLPKNNGLGLGQSILNSIEAGADAYNANPGVQLMGPWGSQSNNGGGGGGGGGGGNSNPYYDQLASMYRAQGAAEAAGMRDSIRQMLIGMGLVPEGFQDKFGALDDATRALINKNTETGISTYARLNEQKKLGLKDLINRLNSRGLRRSGARGYGLRKNQLNYDRNLSDVLSQLMQQVGGMYSNYSANEYARQAALIQAAMNYYSGGGGSSYTPGPSSFNTGNPLADSIYNSSYGVGADWFAPLANSNLGNGGSGGGGAWGYE